MKNILLVEDDNTIAKNLILLLNSEGFSVMHASTYSHAIKSISENKFDLSLIDISLPDGNGFTLFNELNEIQEVPAIFLTAYGDESSVVTGLNMGAYDYITKPFRPHELIARIKNVLRKTGSSASTFEIGGLHIDITSSIVKRDNIEILLSPLEYRLLLIFINNPKSLITRNRLLDELWDASGEFVNDNTLTVYIKRLRKKIEENPLKPQIILTVRGMGYRLGDKNA